MLEEELADPDAESKVEVKNPDTFNERVDRKLVRSIELSDISKKPEAHELRSMKKLKQYRQRRLSKFTLLVKK